MKLKVAVCPFCSGNLSIPENRKNVICMYCGKNIVVQEAIEKAVRPTIENYLALASSAQKSGNNQEAYDYYTKILELDPKNYEAWFGKGEAAGWLSRLDNYRLPEMIAGVENAVKFAPTDKKEELKKTSANMINAITIAFYKLASDHHYEFGRLDRAGQEFLDRIATMILGLELAHSYLPSDTTIIENIIHLLKAQIEGFTYKDFDEYGEKTSILRLTKSSESVLKAKMDEYVEKRKILDPSYETPEIKKKSRCFIATATLGDNNHPHLVLLREFRDDWLSNRPFGQIFIEKYYHYSPYFADLIRERKKLRWISSTFVVEPCVRAANTLLRKK